MKPRFASPIQFTRDDPDLAALAAKDPTKFLQRVRDLATAGKFGWGQVRDLKALYRATRDVEVSVLMRDPIDQSMRMLTTSAFPILCGVLTEAGINAAYDEVPKIGDQLVQDVDDPKETSHYVNILSSDDGKSQDQRDETEPYPLMGASEERYQIDSQEDGRRIAITQKLIETNNAPGIVQRIDALGRWAGNLLERKTLRRVCDVYGSASAAAAPYVYRPNGVGASLYTVSTTAHSRAPGGTRLINNDLVDVTDLEAARVVLANMRDDLGQRIGVPVTGQMILLVPDGRVSAAQTILASAAVSGVENEISQWGPSGSYRPRLLSSPLLDDLSTTAWYLGRFVRQFVRKHRLRLEYVALSGTGTVEFLRRRVAFEARVALDFEIGAIEHNEVVQCLSGSVAATAPTAPVLGS